MADEEIQVHEGRRAGIVVSVRLGPSDAELLGLLRRKYGGNLSAVMRQGLHALAVEAAPGRVAYESSAESYTGGTASESFPPPGQAVATGQLALS